MRSWKKGCKKTSASLTAAVLSVAAVLGCTACGSGERASTMSLVKTAGSVAVYDDGGKTLQAAEQLKLYSGYRMDTHAESYAWINLDHVKLTKMDEESEIEIRKDGKKLEIIVNSGNLFFNITEPLQEDESLDIRTSNMLVGIRGTCGWVESSPDSTDSAIYVLEGTVECAGGSGNTEKISAGQKAAVAEEITVEPMEISDIPDFVLQEERPADSFGGNMRFLSWADSGLEDHVMDWGDAWLEEEMRQATGIHEVDIMLSDVWEMTELDCALSHIQDISALSELKNLMSLDLSENEITDVSPLKSLTNLTSLNLSWNKIADISSLENLINLTALDLNNNYELKNISALANLTNLTDLNLFYDYQVGDISALAGLTKLTKLNLENTGITDIDILGNLTNLVSLNLSHNRITDISALGNLVNLEKLQLAFTEIVDYSPLDNLPHIDRGLYDR